MTVGLSASVAILGLMIDLLSLLQRQVRFRELSACWNVGALAGGGSGLALALLGAGVWAFVVQRVVMDAVPLLGRWAATRRLRRPLFSRRHARELLGCSGLGERLRRQPRRVSSTGVLTRC